LTEVGVLNKDSQYAQPSQVASVEDCDFYHVMDIPGFGLVDGPWDLRHGVDDYLGHVPLADRRVLEIGPASGFLTFEMEKRGAHVVAVEVTDDPGWDFVPYPASFLKTVYGPRREHMRRLKNSFWFGHPAHGSKAKLWYGDVYKLPEALGHFDVAVMGALLLHCHSPLRIVEQCALRAEQLVITDLFVPELAGEPICRLVPSRENHRWDTWWQFSPDFFVQFLGVLGFTDTKVTTHVQQCQGRPTTLFTVVAAK
jgi:O-methyltransferase